MTEFEQGKGTQVQVIADSIGPNGKRITTFAGRTGLKGLLGLWSIDLSISWKQESENEYSFVVTATEWNNFFKRSHPHWLEWHTPEEAEIHWKSEPNLDFPAEIYIQQLAIKIKKAMDESKPEELRAGDWHRPFITQDDLDYFDSIDLDWSLEKLQKEIIKLSAARCAYTSYGRNSGRSIEDELNLADRLMRDKHWSPFEHQAMAVKCMDMHPTQQQEFVLNNKGLQLHFDDTGWHLWSRNFQGFVQYRSLVDGQ